MLDQKKVKNILLKFENDFPVNDWEVDGLKVWPIIRNQLFLSLLRNVRSIQERTINTKKINARQKGKLNLLITGVFWYLKIKQRKKIFVGSKIYRVKSDDVLKNRFFDIYIEKNNYEDSLYFFEIDFQEEVKYYNSELILNYNKYFNLFVRMYLALNKRVKFNLPEFDTFLKSLDENQILPNSFQYQSKENFINYIKTVIISRVKFFKILLKRIKPKELFILCYYSPTGYSLMAAANKLGIETIDYQHGPISKYHLAYGSWTNIPIDGFEVMPRKFWVWDKFSKMQITDWVDNTKIYSIDIVGNFWLNFWESNFDKINSDIEEGFVLYTLQSYSFDQHFNKNITHLIKNNNLKWFIRLHPGYRGQKEKIQSFIKLHNLFDKIEIDLATNLPLPLLLKKSLLHVTNSSGCALEASLLGKKTIILDQIGKNYYNLSIKSGKMIYIDKNKDTFFDNFNQYLRRLSYL